MKKVNVNIDECQTFEDIEYLMDDLDNDTYTEFTFEGVDYIASCEGLGTYVEYGIEEYGTIIEEVNK